MTVEIKIHRQEILATASEIISNDRNNAYGEPEDNFQAIADIWNWWLADRISPANPINAHDVAEMLDGMKKARRRHNPLHLDSHIDSCGYVACGYEIICKQLEGSEQ